MRKLFIILLFSVQILNAKQDGVFYTLLGNSQDLTYNTVNSITQDNSGNMWFATYNGILKYNGSSWVTYNTTNGLISNTVYSTTVDHLGNIWFGMINGAMKYDGTWNTYLSAHYIISLCKAGNYLWLGQDGIDMIFRYNDVITESYILSSGAYAVNSFTNSTSYIWGTSYRGIFSLTKTTNMFDIVEVDYDSTSTAGGLGSNDCFTLEIDNSGNIWVGTLDNYIYVFSGFSWLHITNISNSIIRHIKRDLSGNMWVATYGGGVFKTSNNGVSWINYTVSNGLADNNVRSIYQDVSGNMWFGTNNGISKFNGSTWVNYH